MKIGEKVTVCYKAFGEIKERRYKAVKTLKTGFKVGCLEYESQRRETAIKRYNIAILKHNYAQGSDAIYWWYSDSSDESLDSDPKRIHKIKQEN